MISITKHVSGILNLTDASAANRRTTSEATTKYPGGQMLTCVVAKFTTTQARDITISLYDVGNDIEYPIDIVLASTVTVYSFIPTCQVAAPDGFEIRVAFSQAGGACSATVLITGYLTR